MISKIQDWWILPWNHVYHLYKSVSFTKKRPQRRETGIKDRWEEMEYGFLFGRFYPEKQDYLFRCSVAPGNFLLERPKKSCYLYFPPDFPETFCKMINSVYVFFFQYIYWQVILVFWKWVIIIKIKFPCLCQLLQIYSFWHMILISKHRCFNYIYKVIRNWWLFWVITCLQKKKKKKDRSVDWNERLKVY